MKPIFYTRNNSRKYNNSINEIYTLTELSTLHKCICSYQFAKSTDTNVTFSHYWGQRSLSNSLYIKITAYIRVLKIILYTTFF